MDATMNFKKFAVFLIMAILLLPGFCCGAVAIEGDLTQELIVKPGETYKGTITVSNTEDKPQEVIVYQTDYLFRADGSNDYGEPGKAPRSNANWIIFSPKRFVIPPKGVSTINYSATVPDKEGMTGTYWSLIMIEGVDEGSAEPLKTEKGKIKMGIKQVVRYGAQIITHIGDTGTLELKFLNKKLVKEKDKTFLQVDVENTGEKWARPVLWVELHDEKGKLIDKFEGGKRRIFPGTSVRYSIDLSKVPKGKYKIMVILDCGDDNIFGAKYTLDITQ